MHRRIVAGLAAASVSALALPARAQAQEAVIAGRVTADRSGQGVSGVTIAIPELGVGTLTNDVGNYTLSIPAARVRGQAVVLQARFIGYRQQRRSLTLAAGRQTQNFTLETDANRLTEVVVTGVSVATERAKVPFAVSRLDSTSTPVAGINPLQQIQGKVPGANIVMASGRPGAAPSVLLRGPKSINATGRTQDPLYIVDGVILAGTIADLNAEDIESVEVVKGAAAASLYGSQAANGVVQITTKRGRGGRDGVRFGARTEYGVSDVEREIAIAQRHALLMDPTQTRFCIANGFTANSLESRGCYRTADWTSEAMRINDTPLDFASATTSLSVDLGSGLQGQDARRMFQTNPWPGPNYNAVQQFVNPKPLGIANLDMTAKFGGTNLFASLNTSRQGGGIEYLDGYRRSSVRLNGDQQVGSQLQVNLSTFYSRSDQDGLNQEGGGGAFFRLTRTPPIVDLSRTDSRGRLLIRPNIQGGGAQNENPLYSLQNIDRVDINNRFVGALSTRYTPLRWLNADASVGYDQLNQNGRQFVNKGFRTTGPAASPGTATTAGNRGQLQNYAANGRSINAQAGVALPGVTPVRELRVSPSVRVQYLQQDQDFRLSRGANLSASGTEDLQNAAQNTLFSEAFRTSVRQLTYSGGVNLEYKERYILDANVRRDGNSTFGPGNQWATYGRIAGSWIASSEPFFQPLAGKVDLLKILANYGTSGLAPGFAAQYETLTLGTGGLLRPQTLGNRNLRPQVDAGYEVGFELGVLRSVNLTATYAASDTRDQILQVTPQAATVGFPLRWVNAGTLSNRTIEASLAFPVVRAGKFDWQGRLNFERTRTTITKLNVAQFTLGGNELVAANTSNLFLVREGETFGSFYGRKFISSCGELPAAAAAQCGGAGSQFQRNSDGLIVWTGGRDVNAGYTENLWNATLPRDQSPYPGVPLAWGHPITQRDPQTGLASTVRLGQALPKFRWSAGNTITFGRLSAYGLVDAAIGQSVYNQSRQWSYLDFLSRDQDQTGKGVGDVKPASYYYRTQENPAGIGGLYDQLGAPVSFFVEKASFAKLREATLSYKLGRVARVGDWTVGVTGRNLYTWTKYKGFDPEVGLNPTPVIGRDSGAGALGSGALSAVDAFNFPNLRSVSLNLSTRF
jgi:TonB-linked SusC/RagA family outer membrane protein